MGEKRRDVGMIEIQRVESTGISHHTPPEVDLSSLEFYII